MEKLRRYNVVAPDDGNDVGWDLEYDENGDMVYYDDVKDLERKIKELEEELEKIHDIYKR